MKVALRCFAIIALFLTMPSLPAQPYGDISIGVGLGNSAAARASFDFVLESQLTLSVFFQMHDQNSLLFEENAKSIFAGGMVGYAPALGELCRFNFRGGVGYYSVKSAESFNANPVSRGIGVLVDPRFEFLLSRGFGLGIGGYAVFAGRKELYGINLDLMFGNLRD